MEFGVRKSIMALTRNIILNGYTNFDRREIFVSKEVKFKVPYLAS